MTLNNLLFRSTEIDIGDHRVAGTQGGTSKKLDRRLYLNGHTFGKSLYIEAGIPEASSHTGRRTFITALAERGIDLKAIATLAGHSNIRTTALYVDANPLKLSRILSDVSW